MRESETLPDCWRHLVERDPSAAAVIDGANGRVWTRAEISGAAMAWLAALSPGARAAIARRRVVMAEPNGPAWFHVFLGLLEAGAIPALADSKETPERLSVIARACRASAVWREGKLSIADAAAPAVRRRDWCLIKLTSGSTGTPRALPFTHAQMLADGRQIAATMRIAPGDLNLGVVPLGHSYGLGNLVVPLLEQGTPVLCSASPFPQALAADCARWKPAVFPAVPTLLRALVRADVAPESLGSLRLVISAGAPLSAGDAAGFAEKFGRRVHSLYGTSETGGICFDRKGGAVEAGRGVGTPVEGVRLRWRRGGGKRFTVESAAVFGRGRFSPADRGGFNEAGELMLLGRAGRTLKIAGRRLDPVEVEAALRALPGVRDAFVAAHPARADALAAAVAVDGAGRAMPQAVELRGMLAAHIAAWKIPERILVLAAFPVTQRGKTDRSALERMLAV